jgi:hypothetical protein
MEQENRILTHFYRRNPEVDGWIFTTFITRIKGGHTYFSGMSDHIIPREKIDEDVELGSLVVLEKTIHIGLGQTVWIYADSSAYLAAVNNPRDGEKIYDERLLSNYDYIEKVVVEKLRSRDLNTNDPAIEPLLSENYWKTLVDILIAKIRAGEINREQFTRVGYIFARLGPLYNADFKKLLNRHDVAYSEGELRFMASDLSFQRWDIYIEGADPLDFFTRYSDFDIVSQAID